VVDPPGETNGLKSSLPDNGRTGQDHGVTEFTETDERRGSLPAGCAALSLGLCLLACSIPDAGLEMPPELRGHLNWRARVESLQELLLEPLLGDPTLVIAK